MHRDSVISIDMGGTKVLGCVVNSKEWNNRPRKKANGSNSYKKKICLPAR